MMLSNGKVAKMPDKLTDNEIKKALELCLKNECDKCPFNLSEVCQIDLMKLLFDLINRLQAENERLKFVRTRDAQRYNEKISDQAHTNCILIDLHSNAIKEVKELEDRLKTAKAEAYEEFAERLKENSIATFSFEGFVLVEEIDNLLKELVGEDNPKNNVKCIDCEYLEFKTPYGVCGEGYMGIVHPDDSCGKGKLKETAEEEK